MYNEKSKFLQYVYMKNSFSIEVADMRECLEEKNRLEQETHALLVERNQQWEVCLSIVC